MRPIAGASAGVAARIAIVWVSAADKHPSPALHSRWIDARELEALPNGDGDGIMDRDVELSLEFAHQRRAAHVGAHDGDGVGLVRRHLADERLDPVGRLLGESVVVADAEVTLAHHGVLMLDELPEFSRSVLEALRQPLEDGTISIARVGGRWLYPARFSLVGTMNLCPCGGRGDARSACSCSPQQLDRYRDKLSRALFDRFDLVVALPRPRATELASSPGEKSATVRRRVVAAREALRAATPELDAASDELLARAVDRLPLSGRGRSRVMRVARTIAALAGSAEVRSEHLAEALSYRSPAELTAR